MGELVTMIEAELRALLAERSDHLHVSSDTAKTAWVRGRQRRRHVLMLCGAATVVVLVAVGAAIGLSQRSGGPTHTQTVISSRRPVRINHQFLFTPGGAESAATLTAGQAWTSAAGGAVMPRDVAARFGTLTDVINGFKAATPRYAYRDRLVWGFTSPGACSAIYPKFTTPSPVPPPCRTEWTFVDAVTGDQIVTTFQ
jgi:hypothetical protein